MFIDLHMHECTCSKDSSLKLEEIVNVAKGRGLHGICITDHDSMGLRAYAEQYTIETGFPIFVGIEYYSLDGDIVAFGIDHYPKERIEAQLFIDEVNRQGGVCFSAHPFRNNNRGLGKKLTEVKGLHGVEVLNGSTSSEANDLAATYAKRLQLVSVGASDCHVIEKIGIYATYFPEWIYTMEDLVNAFLKGQPRPVYWKDGHYYSLEHEKQGIGKNNK